MSGRRFGQITCDSNSSNSRIVKCGHNIPAKSYVSGTELNPGRGFFCCPYWKEPSKNCLFWRWVDQRNDEEETPSSNVIVADDEDIRTKYASMEINVTSLKESLKLVEEKAERRKQAKKCLFDDLVSIREENTRLVGELKLANARLLFVLFLFVGLLVGIAIAGLK
ncbi:unnamed protein product [Linum trigynum]|uniref:GRF-type domain-containing protein n=1 Tax=Linum trigynum TaxID=586398 RepID=A0AAV2G6E2_9ROSI